MSGTAGQILRILGVAALALSTLAVRPSTPAQASQALAVGTRPPVPASAVDSPNPRADAVRANDGAEHGFTPLAGIRKPSDSLRGPNGPRAQVRDTHETVNKRAGRLSTGQQDPVGMSAAVIENSPLAADEYQGFFGMNSDDNSSFVEPADSQIAVSAIHVVEWMSLVGRHYNKAGGLIDGPGALGAGVYDLTDFFSIAVGASASNPELLYDLVSDRFFGLLVAENAATGTGYLHVTVSQTTDPTGTWCHWSYAFPGMFPSYPHIGVTADKFLVTWNAFPSPGPGATVGSQTRVFHKQQLLDCAGVNHTTYAPDLANLSSWPAHNQGVGETGGYVGSLGNGGSATIRVFEFTGTVVPNTLNRTMTTINLASAVTTPPDAEQLDTAIDINTNDARLVDAHRNGGILWFASNTGCNPAGDAIVRSCMNIIKVNQGSLTLNDQAIVGVIGNYLFYPALNTDDQGNLYIVVGRSNELNWASAWHTGWLAGAPAPDNTLSGLIGGQSGYTGSRWGDHFAVSRDAGDPSCVWMVAAYARDTDVNTAWGQYIDAVSYQPFGCTIPRPLITISNAAATEPNAGLDIMTFTASLSFPTSKIVSADYITVANDAVGGVDYTHTVGTLTFLWQEVSRPVNVPILGDLLDENDENFAVIIDFESVANALCGDCVGIGTIQDNDPPPALSINDVSLTEGDAGTKNFNFTVSLSAVSGKTVTVNYNATNGTALAGFDFTAIGTTGLTFNPGETSKPVTVVVNGDTACEGNETFNVNLGGAVNATIADNLGVGTITNDDGTCVSGGRGLTITATGASTKNLSWIGGNAQTGYQLVRYNTITAAANLIPLGAGVTSYNDPAGGVAMFCYVLAATTDGGVVLGLSDLECALPGQESGGAMPTNFSLSLDQTTNATLTWTNAAGVTTLLLQVIPLDGSPITNVNLGPATTSTIQPVVAPEGTCFQLLPFTAAALSTSNVVCGIPGISTLAVGRAKMLSVLEEAVDLVTERASALRNHPGNRR